MVKDPAETISDEEILALFEGDGARAWSLFCERYSDFIYTVLRRSGFDYDGAMDRFVYICEKLSEQNFRRLRAIKYTGDNGDLKAWLRQVIKRFCVNWAWSEDGRKRLLGFVDEMSSREQRIFQLSFWRGQTPFEIYESLRLEHDAEVEIGDVFEALENIMNRLSQRKLWRLLSNLSRMKKTLSLDYEDEETTFSIEPVDRSAETAEVLLQKREASKMLHEALKCLGTRETLVVQFRYEEGMTLGEIAEMMGWEEREAVNLHKSALYKLRKLLR